MRRCAPAQVCVSAVLKRARLQAGVSMRRGDHEVYDAAQIWHGATPAISRPGAELHGERADGGIEATRCRYAAVDA